MDLNNNIPQLPIKIYYHQVNGIRCRTTRTNRMQENIRRLMFDIFVFCDTSLRPPTTRREYNLIDAYKIFPEHTVHRCDRIPTAKERRIKGGVLIAVHRRLKTELIFKSKTTAFEMLVIKVSDDVTSFYICAIYIIPGSLVSVYRKCIDQLKQIIEMYAYDNILILGDFNLPTWSNNTAFKSEHEKTVKELYDYGMEQINNVANHRGRYLDLIFSNNPEFLDCSECRTPVIENGDDVFHHKAINLEMIFL